MRFEFCSFLVTAGQEADVRHAESLLAGCYPSCAVVADRAYDSDRLLELIAARDAKAVIPPRRNRKIVRAYDRIIYRYRNIVERAIGCLKQFRRVATRYDKTKSSFASFI